MIAAEDFLGDWGLEKLIEDRQSGKTTRFSGRCTIQASDGFWAYEELGQMHFPGQPHLAATRRYQWHPVADRIEIRFADGRDFHAIPLSGTCVQGRHARHDCSPDLYLVHYDLAGLDASASSWRARWRVTGPRKDYTMNCLYTLSQSESGAA